jgi:lipocalin
MTIQKETVAEMLIHAALKRYFGDWLNVNRTEE